MDSCRQTLLYYKVGLSLLKDSSESPASLVAGAVYILEMTSNCMIELAVGLRRSSSSRLVLCVAI